MIFDLLELLFTLVKMAITDITALGRVIVYFFNILASIGSVMFVALPETVATLIFYCICLIVLLKFVQFHS